MAWGWTPRFQLRSICGAYSARSNLIYVYKKKMGGTSTMGMMLIDTSQEINYFAVGYDAKFATPHAFTPRLSRT